MSQGATLTINPVSGHPAALEIVIRCAHGRTAAYTGLRPGQDLPSEAALRMASHRHALMRGCHCTDELVERYSARDTEPAR